jgi:hypothetical protein
MGSDYKEVRALLAALTPKVATAREDLNGQALGNSLYGLQGEILFLQDKFHVKYQSIFILELFSFIFIIPMMTVGCKQSKNIKYSCSFIVKLKLL